MAKAKYFTQNNEKVYPISHTKAVYDGNGKVLEDRLTEDETAISSLQTDVKGKANKTDVDNKLNSNSAISDTTVAFTEASVRENIVSNEKSSTLFGKVQKWFSDLKKVAFTGSYNDLIDTPSNATTSSSGLMSASDKTDLDACVETLSADASMFLSSIKSPAPAEFEFVETLSLSNLTLTGDVVFSNTGLFNGYASLTEITSGLNDILQKNVDNGFDFVYYMVHNTNSKRFEFSATDPLYISSSQGGKWYYDGNEIATKSDIPSTSDFLKTSGGTLSGNTTLTSGYGFLSSYSNNLKLLRVNSSSNYFGEQGGATAMYNYFGYRNSANTTTIINHFGSSYNPSYAKNIMNYYGRFAETNHFGANAINSYFGSSSTTSYYRGDTIYLGDSTSHPVYMQGSTSYKVVGTTTGYNTKIHVASSQPSNMSVGDIWFKIPS